MKVYNKNDVDVTFSNWYTDLEQLISFEAIPLDKVKQAIEEIANKYDDLANAWCEREEGRNEAILEVLEILDKLIAESEG